MSRSRCCNNCAKREIGCHSTCEAYAAEVILATLLDSERKKKNQSRDDAWSISERRNKGRKKAGYTYDKRLGQK